MSTPRTFWVYDVELTDEEDFTPGPLDMEVGVTRVVRVSDLPEQLRDAINARGESQ